MKAGRKEMRKAPCSERLSPKIFWKAPMIRRITVPGHTEIIGYKAHPTSAIRREISMVIRSVLMKILFFWVVNDKFVLKPSV